MSALDFVVLIGSMLGIAIYGIWRTRGRRGLNTYLKGDAKTAWFAIGLSSPIGGRGPTAPSRYRFS